MSRYGVAAWSWVGDIGDAVFDLSHIPFWCVLSHSRADDTARRQVEEFEDGLGLDDDFDTLDLEDMDDLLDRNS